MHRAERRHDHACSTVQPAVWLAALILFAGLLWAGCSVQKNYRLLSFFFDGVPNPNALPAAASAGDGTTMRTSPTYVAHRPFTEERCDECHGGRLRPGVDDSGMCLKCHADVPNKHPVMHGPVAVVACLWCHVPHESAFASLLKADARQVCAQCHEPGMLGTDTVPAHADGSRSCLECHSGHGGDARFFLHPGHAEAAGAAPSPGARGG